MDAATRTAAIRRLDEIASGYDPSNPAEQFDYWLKRLQVRSLAPWLLGTRVLELGCATGELTLLLAPLAERLDVVEGSPQNVDAAQRRVPSATFTTSLWEDFEPGSTYSDVVLCNALEHVAEPVPLLARVREWLLPQGRIHVVVPNGLSLHRLVGVELGLQPDPLTLTDGDRAQGHVRNYTLDALFRDVRAAGMRVVHTAPVFLKVLSNHQMLDWKWDLIVAMHEVAQRLPEHGAEIYLTAERA